MKRVDKPRSSSSNIQTRRPGNIGKKDQMPQKAYGSKPFNAAQIVSRVFDATAEKRSVLVRDSATGSESSEVCENMVVHCIDDAKSSENFHQELNHDREEQNNDDDESGSQTSRNSSVSLPQGDFLTTEDEIKNMDRSSRVSKITSPPHRFHGSKSRFESEISIPQTNAFNETPKKSKKLNKTLGKFTTPPSYESSENLKGCTKALSESSEEVKEDDIWEDALNGAHGVESDNEVKDSKDDSKHENEEALNQKIETMENRIGKLKEELKEVAALEISLYSVAQEHGSSAYKLHTPARRLSRLFIHESKNWTQYKLATISGNIVSGLVLVAKSCGNDISRLTFWLSNITVLREIVSQAFGIERTDSNFMMMKQTISLGGKQVNGFMASDETKKFISAMEKVESWIFTQTVESVWLQVLIPHLRSSDEDLVLGKGTGTLLGPALGNQKQGTFSINLWKYAFQEALQRLCPIQAGGHECGCLPVLSKMVMEQCIARLDAAMFNAILRESAHQIPTDLVSDPIGDSKVLPILAGELSFGSGAQLKNAVGNWLRWLTNNIGIDSDDSLKENDDNLQGIVSEFEPFCLLNELSDLLMLPKGMLMDCSIREEVCPSIGLTLIKRILCNFTPDEFDPEPVPGIVLEELNAESMVHRKSREDPTTSFPRPAPAVCYAPPSCADLAEKVAECSGNFQLSRNTSVMKNDGYISDEELDELESSLEHTGFSGTNERYGLFRQA